MNLVVIETPLELVNAIEARDRFQLSAAHLLILTGAFSRAAFAPLIKPGVWETVSYFRFPDVHRLPLSLGLGEALATARQLVLRARFDRALRRYGRVDRIFLGNYLEVHKHYMRHVHHVVPHSEVVLLDDGTDTLVVSEQLRRQPPRPASRRGFAGLREWPRRRFVDWESTPAASLTLFSVFDVELRATDVLVRNDYAHLRETLRSAAAVGYAYFLGQSLVEDGYLELDDYLDALGTALARIRHCRVIYVPHPRERQSTIDAVSRRFRLEVERPGLPIECHLIATNRIPREIASFFCSALVNCSTIFGDLLEISSFKLDERRIVRHHDTCRAVYAYLDSLGGRRIRLHEFQAADVGAGR